MARVCSGDSSTLIRMNRLRVSASVLRVGRGLKNGGRAVDRVDLGFELAGQRVFDGGFNDQFLGAR